MTHQEKLLSNIKVGYIYDYLEQGVGRVYQCGTFEVPYNLSDEGKRRFIAKNALKVDEFDFIVDSIKLYTDLNLLYFNLVEEKVLSKDLVTLLSQSNTEFQFKFKLNR